MKGLQGCSKESLCNSKLQIEASTIKDSKVAFTPILGNVDPGFLCLAGLEAEKGNCKLVRESLISGPLVDTKSQSRAADLVHVF